MDEATLFESLREMVREHRAPIHQAICAQAEAEAQLTDDEWLAQVINQGEGFPILEQFASTAAFREAMIQRRRDSLESLREEVWEEGNEQMAREYLPHLLQVRAEAGAEGPLTSEQYDATVLRYSQRYRAGIPEKLRAKLESTTDERKRHVIHELLTGWEESELALQEIRSGAQDPERLEEIAEKFSERMRALTEHLKRPSE